MQAHQVVIDKLVNTTQVTTVLNGMSTCEEGDFPGMLTAGNRDLIKTEFDKSG